MSKRTLLENWPDEYAIKMVNELIEDTRVKKSENDCPWTWAELEILEDVLVDWKKIKLANEEKTKALELEIHRLKNLVLGRDIDGVLIPGKPLQQG